MIEKMIEILASIVTGLGCILSVLSLYYLLFGDKIVAQSDGSEKIEIGNNKLEISKVFGAFLISVTTAILPLGLIFFISSQKESGSVNPHQPRSYKSLSDESSYPIRTAEEICDSLKGKYKILREYMFIDTKISDSGIVTGLRGKSVKAFWHATECKPDGKGGMVLYGTDETVHSVSVEIDNKYYEVTDSVGKLDSKIYINKDGTHGRTLSKNPAYPLKENLDKRNLLISRFSDEEKKDIIEAIGKYQTLRKNRFIHKTGDPCHTTVGKMINKHLVISYCPTDEKETYPWYFRSMLECSDDEDDCRSIYNKFQ